MPRQQGFYGGWAWNEVRDAYYDDRLEQAYNLALELGMGAESGYGRFFRQIEGEYLTRKDASQVEVNDWLIIEFVESETPNSDELTAPILAACDDIARRLGIQHSARAMVSVLTAEADAPWAVGRFGYYIQKRPYGKVCIPLEATQDPARLHNVVVHEYAHHIVSTVAGGHAPRWMDEMIAMQAQGGPDPRVVNAFVSGQVKWLSPHSLNVQYVAEREGASGAGVYHAYQQSACIGRYLVDLKGEASLGDLLRGFSDNSFVKDLAILTLNIPPADEALKEVYGFGEKELFKRTIKWLRG